MFRHAVWMIVAASLGGCTRDSNIDDTASGDGTGQETTSSSTNSATSNASAEGSTGSGTVTSGEPLTSSTTTSGEEDASSTESSGSEDASTASTEEVTTEPPGESGSSTGWEEEPDPLWVNPNLWYAVENKLHYIEIDPADGTVVRLVTSTITTELIDGQNGITMLEDGSLLGSRERAGETQIFHVPEPPTEPSTIEVTVLGVVPDELRIEALYTDCQGLVYLMDTGSDTSSADGNRLIRFTGDYLAGDLAYEVITDLENASVADIDDMGPGIDEDGEITDGQGFAIDSGTVYDFDYNTGTGTSIGMGGTWGVHALGGPLFDDGRARLYLLDRDAELVEADPVDLTLSPVLVTGPAPEGDAAPGWSSLAGPLTECESTLPVPQ